MKKHKGKQHGGKRAVTQSSGASPGKHEFSADEEQAMRAAASAGPAAGGGMPAPGGAPAGGAPLGSMGNDADDMGL